MAWLVLAAVLATPCSQHVWCHVGHAIDNPRHVRRLLFTHELQDVGNVTEAHTRCGSVYSRHAWCTMSVIMAHFRVARNAGNGLAPVGVLFQFLNLLRKEGPQKWVFDELANIAQMRFKFAEEEDACEYALRLAADAPYYAPEHLLNGHYLYDQWNPTLVRSTS